MIGINESRQPIKPAFIKMIGYKIAKHGEKRVVATIMIPSDAITNMNRSNIAVKETAKYRTNKALILKIEDNEGNCYDSCDNCYDITASFARVLTHECKVGELMESRSYDMDAEQVWAEGIHYFLSRRVAENYGLIKIANGLFTQWHENGQKSEEGAYVDGKTHGLYQRWCANGQKIEEANYVDGKLHGLRQRWYVNGGKRDEATYVTGVRHYFKQF